MSNTRTVIVLFAVSYVVPLSLMFVRRIWLKAYFAVVFASILWLGYETHIALQTQEDCRAGCALVIGIVVLTVTAVLAGSLLAVLSALAFKKSRPIRANKSMQTTSEDASRGRVLKDTRPSPDAN